MIVTLVTCFVNPYTIEEREQGKLGGSSGIYT